MSAERHGTLVLAAVLTALLAPASADGATIRLDAPLATSGGSISVEPAVAATRPSNGDGAASGPGHRIAGGESHVCAVLANGDVSCWGNDGAGRRGDGLTLSIVGPTHPIGIHDAVSVDAGIADTCVVRAGGQVACWGDDTWSQLGPGVAGGSGKASAIPTGVTGVSNAIQVATSGSHACALTAAGTVWCWGDNEAGELGRGTMGGSSPTPMPVTGISGAIAVDTGPNFTCALLADGTARCWGLDLFGQLGAPTPGGGQSSTTPVAVTDAVGHVQGGIKAIGLGASHACGLLANGTVMCWGENSAGTLGNGVPLPGLSQFHAVAVVGVSSVTSLAVGPVDACAVLASGSMQCWGAGGNGQLGPAVTGNTSQAVAVTGVSGVRDAAAGSFATCAQLAVGITCWGYNFQNSLGRPTATSSNNPPGPVVGNFTGGLIEAGAVHTCALLARRTVQCWGGDGLGQLGNGPTVSSGPGRVSVTGLANVFALSAGTNHTCAIVIGGQVYCWGANDKGQIGNGDSGAGKHVDTPAAVSGLANAIAVSAGGDHTCAVKADFTAVCWGGNATGQLGNDVLAVQDSPTPVSVHLGFNQPLTGLATISAGSGHTCATAQSGSVWCWGDDGAGQLGNGVPGGHTWIPQQVRKSGAPNDFVIDAGEVVARYVSTCLVDTSWHGRCWGGNGWGQLGLGGGGDQAYATLVPDLTSVAAIGPASNHGVHFCAVRADATGQCWGANDQGQIGVGVTSQTQSTPATVLGLSGAVQVSVGFQDSCALLANGSAMCWGNNASGQLGSGAPTQEPTPTLVTGFSVGAPAVQIDAGASHTCALLANGTARCWGAGGSGRLGTGSTSNRSTPGTVSGLSGATAISAGGSHTCALLATGTARCWGLNSSGQLGNNSTTSHSTPVTVSGLTGAIAISAGGSHTCALLSNGTVKCWGLNSSGQLGDGTTTSRHTPVSVKTSSTVTLSGVVAISAGTSHTCALLSNGTARCWGAGSYGRLGTNSTANKAYATAVYGVTTATAVASRFASISAGGAHTCARLANGTARCWGDGASGRLGNGSTSNHSTPVTVSGLTAVAQVSAGGSHSCALLANGTARCWGSGAYGQLGNGSTTSHSTPVTVSGLAGATSISAGGNHTAATLATGSLRAWGLNSSGQVGDGTTTNRSTPRGVSGF